MKVIDQLKTIRDGYVHIHTPLRFIDINHEYEEKTIQQYKHPVYLTSATLEMRQIGTGESISEEALIRQRAAESIAFELYGEVIERLRGVISSLYEEGPRYDDKIVKSLERLISDLSLKDRKY